MILDDDTDSRLRLAAYYCSPERHNRRENWDLLRSLHANSNLHWCVVGDLNDMLSVDDRIGGVVQPKWLIKRFRDVVVESGLYDLPLVGH